MKGLVTGIIAVVFLVALTGCWENSYSPGNQPAGIEVEPVRAVVVTGGHNFDKEAFLAMFAAIEDVEFVHAVQKDHSEIFESIDHWPYDVIVLYNMTQEISEKRRANFIKLLDDGVGVVMMHHAVAAYQGWDEYRRIVGGKYYLKADKEKKIEASTFKHGTDTRLYVTDKKHPVTQGINDFTVHDETYKNVVFDKGNTPLMTTDDPSSDEVVVWARRYSNAKVCGIEPGHGTSIFADENYLKLVAQAIQWTAKR